MQDYLATRGYQKEQFEELIALLIRQDKVSRIWFETEGKRTICTDSGIRESEADLQRKEMGGLYAEDSTYYWTLYGRQGRWHWGSISLWIIYMLIFQTYYLRGRTMFIS